MSVEADDLRSTLESAFDNAEEGRPATDATQPVRTEAEAPQTSTDSSEAADRGDGRTPRGKFAKRVAAPDAGTDGVANAALAGTGTDLGKADGGEAAAKPVDHNDKAPQSWKPGAREAWSQLPPDVRAEVHRRERETARIVQDTAQARQVTDYVGKLQQQFAPALQAEGVDVLTATSNLMNLASKLRFGTPVEKAQLAAQIVRSYGVDIGHLDAALSGANMPPQGQGQQQMLQDPRVDQLLSELNGIKQQRQQAVVQQAVTEVETFGYDKEFFEDVREDMADLLEVAARRKIDLSLEQAYERACKMHPEISRVLDAREAAKRAGNLQGSTQRARVAASSVRGTPSGGSTSKPADLRGAIEDAFEQVGGR